MTFSGPPCAVCGKEVIGRVLSACGKKYHPECFACEHCHRHILDTEPFAEEDGKPYCPDCFDELFGEKCYACGRPVTDQCIRFNGRIYHPNHFCCKGCGISLLTREYKEDEGEPFCVKCKNIQVRIRATKNDICAKCHKPILGEYIILNGQKIHPEHYRCEACGIDFQGGNCREHDGKNYCLDCYAKIVKSVCAKVCLLFLSFLFWLLTPFLHTVQQTDHRPLHHSPHARLASGMPCLLCLRSILCLGQVL